MTSFIRRFRCWLLGCDLKLIAEGTEFFVFGWPTRNQTWQCRRCGEKSASSTTKMEFLVKLDEPKVVKKSLKQEAK